MRRLEFGTPVKMRNRAPAGCLKGWLVIREPDNGFSQSLQSRLNLLFLTTFFSAGLGTTASISIMPQVTWQIFTQRIHHLVLSSIFPPNNVV